MVIEAEARCAREVSDFDLEVPMVHPDGRRRWMRLHSRPRRLPDGRVIWVGVQTDITERKAFQAELERLVAERTAKLQEMVSELEHFSYTITHDMRAPLRAMQGFADLMTEACAKCPEAEPKMFLQRIETSAARMDSLITDALNYSRAVRQELAVTPMDAGVLLRGMLDSYPEFQPSKAQIQIAGELPLVMGNEAALTQCFSNLIGNAVKFVKTGQKPEITVRGETRDGWVRIWVEDKGIGIPKIMQTRVFELFSRGHQSYQGTGIGLALVRKVVDRMGGRVGVESEEGKGSRFWVELRAVEAGRAGGARRI
jgi:signal transduction histidine kinase